MAIYDHNGTSTAEIGKLYDHNGTSTTQIGKVFDNNGASNRLIYSAEETATLTGAWSDIQTEYTMKWKTTELGNDWTQADISTATAGNSGVFFCGITTSSTITDNESTAYNGVSGYVWGKKWVNGTMTGETTTTAALTSGTTYYLYVGVYYATSHDSTVTITATVS